MSKKRRQHTSLFRSSRSEMESVKAHQQQLTPQTASPAYSLAFGDNDFLLRKDLRPIRIQLELLKPELLQQEHGIESTIVFFGSARIPEPAVAKQRLAEAQAASDAKPGDEKLRRRAAIAQRMVENSKYYVQARALARLISEEGDGCEDVVVTGGGPGIMEAANRGADDVGANNIGLTIVLPHEENPNPFITPALSFRFHYFAIRKMHFLIRARAMVAFPGGFGTMDELFEALTLMQTGKIRRIPILLFGKAFWDSVVNFDALVDEGVISPEDLDLFRYVETAEEAWQLISTALDNETATESE